MCYPHVEFVTASSHGTIPSMLLLTAQGTFLCIDDEGLPFQGDLAAARLHGLHLDPGMASESIGALFERMVVATEAPARWEIGTGALRSHRIELAADGKTLTLSAEGGYYSAMPDRRSVGLSPSSGGWERFVVLEESCFEDLAFILGNSWVIKSTQQVIRPGEIELAPDFKLRIGPVQLDLRLNTPFLPGSPPPAGDRGPVRLFSFVGFVDGWRYEELHFYKPLIYYTAFRAVSVLTQCFLSIRSLAEFGGYDGAVHVITDRSRADFLRHVGEVPPSKLTVQPLKAADWVGFVASKYCILEFAPAWQHQPVIYLDCDIICDAPLEPLLAAAATAGRVTAPIEVFSELAASVAVGAELVRRDGRKPPSGYGFNGGTIGIPNLAAFGGVIEAIRRTMRNHALLFGRDHFRWVDQEVANYVGYMSGLVDKESISRFVRYGWEGTENEVEQRCGLVHFWPMRSDGMSKADAMHRYVQALRAARSQISGPDQDAAVREAG